MNETPVSIRAFSREMGVSDTAVHKAIRAGRIEKGLTEDKKIIVSIAKQEWARNYDETYADRSPTLAQKLAETKTPGVAAGVGGTAPAEGPKTETGGTDSLAAAKRMQAVLKVKQLQIQLQTAQGELVNKNEVYRALFAAGQQLKASILSVPDRCIDDIMAQKTRTDAFNILYGTLVDVLNDLPSILQKATK